MFMASSHRGSSKPVKQSRVNNVRPTVIDFGKRAISNQNFSKIVALPKQALANCGNVKQVEVSLVQDKEGRYLRLRPIRKPVEEDISP
jgi:hypothetical protein